MSERDKDFLRRLLRQGHERVQMMGKSTNIEHVNTLFRFDPEGDVGHALCDAVQLGIITIAGFQYDTELDETQQQIAMDTWLLGLQMGYDAGLMLTEEYEKEAS